MSSGYLDEARAWREWLLRAVAGKPSQLQIMYGIAGERRLPELELPWLPGYEDSRPVRIGNAASDQFQLDVFGEVARRRCTRHAGSGSTSTSAAWTFERRSSDYLEEVWAAPDEGIWEVRGPRRHFTHSKVMAWVALDRAVKDVETLRAATARVDRWRATRDQMHAEVCARGVRRRPRFVRPVLRGQDLDASLLLMPLVGFLPASDPRIAGTVRRDRAHARTRRVRAPLRAPTSATWTACPPARARSCSCTCWLADAYALQGRRAEARAHLRAPARRSATTSACWPRSTTRARGRLLGNFPQAFSHIGLVNTARNFKA